MKRNTDFVMFDDYSNDMDDLAGCSAAIIAALKKERDDAYRMLAYVINKVGEVRIYKGEMYEPAPTICRDYDPNSDEFVFQAINKRGPHDTQSPKARQDQA